MAMNQVPVTLVIESEKNWGSKICLCIKLAGVGRRVEELKRGRKYGTQGVLALTF